MAQFKQPIQYDSAVTLGVAKLRINPARLTAAATGQTLTFNALAFGQGESQLPANARITYAWINIITPFSGGDDVTALTLALGKAGATTELLTAVSIFTGSTGLKPKTGAYALGAPEAAYAPVVTLAATDGNLNTLTTGLVEVLIQYEAISSASLTA